MDIRRDAQRQPARNENPHSNEVPAIVGLDTPEGAHMQAQRKQGNDADTSQYIDVIRGLHVAPAFFHRQLAVNDMR